jgi:glycosyltransferase involved in cell wall biosynthesis
MLVISSDSEGFCNVVVESLICQTPVVSTRCFGPAKILLGDLARGLCEINDDALARAMSDIYYHPPDLSEVDLTIYKTDRICHKYLKLIKS